MVRLAIAVAVAALSLLVGLRIWFVDGILRPVMIDGPSMAPAFCGLHYVVACSHCQATFRCDAEYLPVDRKLACFNCGGEVELAEAAKVHAADEVLLDRWPLLWRMARRGEVVACRDRAGNLTVKRVAAEPGQQLGIRTGDVFDGDQILHKSIDQVRETRVLVHDNDSQPRHAPPRWIGDSAGWQQLENGVRFVPAAHATREPSWLTYHHRAPGASANSSPITDDDPYNQGELQRPLNDVHDFWLEAEFRLADPGSFTLDVTAGQQRFELAIESGRTAELRQHDQLITSAAISHSFRHPTLIEFGLCDAQVILAIDRRTVLCTAYPWQAAPVGGGHNLAIGTTRTNMEVRHLRLWRDVYYLDPDGLSRPWQMPAPLGADEVALLGDNQPVSVDSRNWLPPGVNARDVAGLVYRPFWKSQH